MTAEQEQQIYALLLEENQQQKGFKLLVESCQERLYGHLWRMLRSHEDTNDVLQNVFIKVFRNLHRFEGQSKLYTWIYRIATNECLDYIAKRKRKRAAASLDDTSFRMAYTPRADSYFNEDQAQQFLQDALKSLPQKQSLVFQLRYYEEMPYAEMSEVLETSVGALKASYHHAVKKIEKQIKTRMYEL